MSKFFYIDDVSKIMNDKITDMMMDLVYVDDEEVIIPTVKTVQQYQRFVNMVLDEMEKQNEAYEREMAEYRRKKEEQDATAT